MYTESSQDYYNKRGYTVKEVDGKRTTFRIDSQIEIVRRTEIYYVLQTTHAVLGHGGRDIMRKGTEKYSNITVEIIMIFLNLSEECRLKQIIFH